MEAHDPFDRSRAEIEISETLTEEEEEVLKGISQRGGVCKSDLSDCSKCPINRLAATLSLDTCLDLFFEVDDTGMHKTSYVDMSEAYKLLAEDILANSAILRATSSEDSPNSDSQES